MNDTSLINVSNLSIATDTGKQLIRELSFTVKPGDKTAVIGAEGSGKSSLIEFLAGFEREGFTYRGDFSISGIGGYLPQELPVAWNNTKVMEFLLKSSPYEEFDPAYWNEYNRVIKNLTRVNLPDQILDRDIKVLSGGEKVRVQIGKLLMKNPTYLLFDEPTNNLDIEMVQWLEKFINKSQVPILFVSHDEMLIRRCATSILYLAYRPYDNHPFAYFSSEDYDTFSSRLEHIVKRAEQEKTNLKNELKQLKRKYSQRQSQASGKRNFSGAEDISTKIAMTRSAAKSANIAGQTGKKLKEKQEELEELESPYIDQYVKIDFPKDCEIPQGKQVLIFKRLKIAVNGKILATCIELKITGPEKVGIIGRNGVGKSTLLKIIEESQRLPGIRVGYMPQEFNEIFIDLDKPALKHLINLGATENFSRTLMSRMGFTRDEMENTIENLSGGQRGKLILMHMIVCRANFLILDEPTRNLSPLTAPVLKEQLQEFPGAILMVSHDRQFLGDVCHKILEFSESGLHPVQKENLQTLFTY